MKQFSILLLLLGSVGVFVQSSSGGTSGVRVGSGIPGEFIPTIVFNAMEENLEVTTLGDKLESVELYDESDNLVGSATFSPTSNFSATLNGLSTGIYTVVLTSEEGETKMNAVYKP